MSKKNNIFLLILIFFIFFFSFSVFAQERKLEIKYPKIGDIKPETTSITLHGYVRYIFSFAVMIIGIVIFGAMIWGSFVWLTAGGNPSKVKEGKEIISSAFLGSIILLSSYIVLKIINPSLITLNVPELISFPFSGSSSFSFPEPKKPIAIFRELPLGQSIDGKKGIWSQRSTQETKELLFKDFNNSTSFEAFLTKKRDIDSQNIERISNLNKYLQKLTEECKCGNTIAWCTSPAETFLFNAAVPVGCYGDPCRENTREKIKKTISQDEKEMKDILDYQEKIKNKKKELENTLRQFNEVEREISLCQYQNREIYTLFEFLSIKENYEKNNKDELAVSLSHNFEAKQDPLTFYCQIGGNISEFYSTDLNQLGSIDKSDITDEEDKIEKKLEEVDEFIAEKISCPVEIPLGKIVDNLRELKLLQLAKMERINILIDEIVQQIKDMVDLVSECSEKDCSVNCACIYNPCYQVWSFCPLNPRVPCLQAVGGCKGEPCPKEDIKEKVKEIKETEDEIFSTLNEIKDIFSKADIILKAEKNKLNLFNLANSRTSFSLCSQSPVDPLTLISDWSLSSCRDAINNFGPTGAIIGSCNPRNYFCCTEKKLSSLESFPFSTEKAAPAIITPKTYPVLDAQNNCPEGWDCSDDVKGYNQYNNASDSLKQLLSCMREELDTLEKEKEIKENLGRIVNITDPKLYGRNKTCDWRAGPLKEGGCSFPYSIKEGKEDVSAHYGGPLCRWQNISHAVDIGIETSFEKKYADEIIETAKKCNPSAYIEYLVPGSYDHIHISLAGENNCGVD